MSIVNAAGQMTGTACALLSAVSAGTFFALGGSEYVKVAVTGTSPAAGKIFALRLADGRVVQLADAVRPDVQYVGAFAFVSYAGVAEPTADSAVATIADVAVGGLFDTSAPDAPGPLGVRVEVLDEGGSPVAPAAGQSWRAVFSTAVVGQVASSTQVESYGSAGGTAWKVQ